MTLGNKNNMLQWTIYVSIYFFNDSDKNVMVSGYIICQVVALCKKKSVSLLLLGRQGYNTDHLNKCILKSGFLEQFFASEA